MCIPTNVATAAYPSLPNEGMPNAAPTSAVSVFCRAVTNVTLEEKSLSLKPIAMNKAQEFVKQHHRHNHEVKFGPRFAISVVDAGGKFGESLSVHIQSLVRSMAMVTYLR